MKKALKLAKKGLFTTTYNPRVGCVLVSRGRIIGKGYHKRVGEQHAEVFAIENADEFAQGSTAFVTLEPCSHFGKNPPCADALIKAQVKKVVVCNLDPNPLVAGQGMAKLKAAGIKVKLLKNNKAGAQLNAGFFNRMTTGLPLVRLKIVHSLDGRSVQANEKNKACIGKKTRQDIQYWRARSQAIMTGIETILQEDCRLTVRPQELAKKYQKLPNDFNHYQPMRVVLDTHLRVNLSNKILTGLGRKVVMTASFDFNKIKHLESQGVEVIPMPTVDGKIDLNAALVWLGEQKINELLVESGATLAGNFIQQGLVNQLILYTIPIIMGSHANPLFHFNSLSKPHDIAFKDYRTKKLGSGLRLIFECKNY